jgi:hypothetical protein
VAVEPPLLLPRQPQHEAGGRTDRVLRCCGVALTRATVGAAVVGLLMAVMAAWMTAVLLYGGQASANHSGAVAQQQHGGRGTAASSSGGRPPNWHRCASRLVASCQTADACLVCAGHDQHVLRGLGCTSSLVAGWCAGQADVYVDASSGDDEAAGSSAAPLRSLSAAQSLARQLGGALARAGTRVTVHLAGTFELAANETATAPAHGPLKLWAQDAGQRWVGWAARGNASLSGGLSVPPTSWYQCDGATGASAAAAPASASASGGFWCAPLPAAAADGRHAVSALFDGSERRPLVRTPILTWDTPIGGEGAPGSYTGFVYSAGDVGPAWDLRPEALAQWRAVAFHQWTKSYHTVRSVDRATRTITFGEAAPYQYGHFVDNTASGKRWYLENVPELRLSALSTQWRVRLPSTLVYAAPAGWRPAAAAAAAGSLAPGPTGQITLPVLPFVMSVQNSQDVEIDGLTLGYAAIACPPPLPPGGVDRAGGVDRTCGVEGTQGMTGQLLLAHRVRGLGVRGCRLLGSGGDALLAQDCDAVHVGRVVVHGAGGSGVLLDSCGGNSSVTQSRVLGAGEVVQHAAGITIKKCVGGLVQRCEVANVSHSRGIRWDSEMDAGAWTTIEYNHIHHCGCGGPECLCDGGGLDGASSNARLPVYLRHNLIHHISARDFGGAGMCVVLGSAVCLVSAEVWHALL